MEHFAERGFKSERNIITYRMMKIDEGNWSFEALEPTSILIFNGGFFGRDKEERTKRFLVYELWEFRLV